MQDKLIDLIQSPISTKPSLAKAIESDPALHKLQTLRIITDEKPNRGSLLARLKNARGSQLQQDQGQVWSDANYKGVNSIITDVTAASQDDGNKPTFLFATRTNWGSTNDLGVDWRLAKENVKAAEFRNGAAGRVFSEALGLTKFDAVNIQLNSLQRGVPFDSSLHSLTQDYKGEEPDLLKRVVPFGEDLEAHLIELPNNQDTNDRYGVNLAKLDTYEVLLTNEQKKLKDSAVAVSIRNKTDNGVEIIVIKDGPYHYIYHLQVKEK